MRVIVHSFNPHFSTVMRNYLNSKSTQQLEQAQSTQSRGESSHRRGAARPEHVDHRRDYHDNRGDPRAGPVVQLGRAVTIDHKRCHPQVLWLWDNPIGVRGPLTCGKFYNINHWTETSVG